MISITDHRKELVSRHRILPKHAEHLASHHCNPGLMDASAEALLMFSSRLESTAQQFSQSEYQSIRDKSQGMKLLAREIRREIDKRISI